MNYIIVDGLNLAYRSHFAFNTLMTTTGLLSGCVYGFLVGIKTIKSKFSDFHMIVAWDNEATRKKNIYAEYKNNRSKMTFIEQINDLKKILCNLNVSQAECIGEEADDVIASLVKMYQTDTNKIYIHSNDKDLLQLVKDGHVIVIRPRRGKNSEEYYDEETVKNEFKIEPEKFVFFQCFRGDDIDNVPGVPRLRSTVITRLVNKYGTPQNIYDHLDEEKLTVYEKEILIQYKSQVVLNMQLVRLYNDLKLNIEKGESNIETIEFYMEKYQIRSIKANSFVNSFIDRSFSFRTTPIIKNYSLFD